MPLSIGELLQGRYRIEALLGKGGMGAVYRAWDDSLSISVAIKENLDASEEARKQFHAEARILARLSHPNLPRVTDHFFIPGQGQYLVMDYVDGEDLGSMLRWLGVLPEPQVLEWISQVCDALAYLHRQPSPVIHRDVKPANIKIRSDGRAMLVDFGIAKVYDPSLSTTMGAKAVSPGYSPPEQYGDIKTDACSDVYALGATLYHLLTGEKPLDGLQRIAGQVTMPAPRERNPGISPQVEHAILKAVDVATERRFQDVDAMRKALTQPLDGPQLMTPSAGVRSPQRDDAAVSSSRSWLWLAATAIIGLLLVVGGAGLVLTYGPRLVDTWRRHQDETTPAVMLESAPVTTKLPEVAPEPTETLFTTTAPDPTPSREAQMVTATRPMPTPDRGVTALALCAGPDFVGLQCRSSALVFPPTTEAIYASWQSRDSLVKRTQFTRRWYKDGILIVESTHVAGETARWTPSDGISYYVYLSATEGTGKRVWNAPWLPRGAYRFELLLDGVLTEVVDFTIRD
jgi:eukaryotic-like serine/threonine-protein kinase